MMDKTFNYRAVDSAGIVVEDVANAENMLFHFVDRSQLC